MNTNPDISVVIPTHNRATSLRRTLDALASQTCPPDAFEVIVIADGCCDETAAMLRDYHSPYRLRMVEQPGIGAAAARNRGAREAHAPIVLFIDDDVEPSPPLVETHRRTHESNSRCVGIGPYLPSQSGAADYYRIICRNWWHDLFRDMGREGHRFSYRDVVSGNLSVRREFFLSLGGFDEAFRGCGAEDWELGVRLIDAGAELTYLPQAMAYHHDHETTDLDRTLRRARQEGRGDVLIGQRHLHLRRCLPLASVNPMHAFHRHLPVWVAYELPTIGDALAWLLRHGLPLFEALRLRRSWRKIYGLIRWYWYWRGVAEFMPQRHALARFIRDAPSPEQLKGPCIEIDLQGSFDAAEQALDQTRPVAAVIRHGPLEIARLHPQPGAEPLRGRHLRFLLWGKLRDSAFCHMMTPASLTTSRGQPSTVAITATLSLCSSVSQQTSVSGKSSPSLP